MAYEYFGAPIKSTEVALAAFADAVESVESHPFPGSAFMKPATTLPAVRVASSSVRDPILAATNLASQLNHEHLGCVLFFCSAEYDLSRLGSAFKHAFQNVRVCGCTCTRLRCVHISFVICGYICHAI